MEALAADREMDGAIGQGIGFGGEVGGRERRRQLPEACGRHGSRQLDIERDVGHLGDIGEGEGYVGVGLEGEGQHFERVVAVGGITYERIPVNLGTAGAVAGKLVGLGDGGARHAIDVATGIGIATDGLDGFVEAVGKRVGP